MSLCSNRTKRRIQKVGCHAENGWRNSFLSGIIHSCVLNDSREILNLRFPEIVFTRNNKQWIKKWITWKQPFCGSYKCKYPRLVFTKYPDLNFFLKWVNEVVTPFFYFTKQHDSKQTPWPITKNLIQVTMWVLWEGYSTAATHSLHRVFYHWCSL